LNASPSPKFLLVEDDEVDQEAMMRAFAAVGAEDCLTVAGDGLEAMALLRQWNDGERHELPFVVITDLNLPRMTGIELLKTLRADSELSRCAVFVCTTSSSEADRLEAFSNHIAGYISKSRIGTEWDRVARLLLEYWDLTEKPV
jgi:CheY-like chemotaxis protein